MSTTQMLEYGGAVTVCAGPARKGVRTIGLQLDPGAEESPYVRVNLTHAEAAKLVEQLLTYGVGRTGVDVK